VGILFFLAWRGMEFLTDLFNGFHGAIMTHDMFFSSNIFNGFTTIDDMGRLLYIS